MIACALTGDDKPWHGLTLSHQVIQPNYQRSKTVREMWPMLLTIHVQVTESPYGRSRLLNIVSKSGILASMWRLNTSAWKALDILPCSCPKWKVAINVVVLAQLYKYSLQIQTKMPPSTIALLLLWISQYPDRNIVSSTHLLQPLASAARKLW
jgi:hypothetical protein